MPYQATRQLTHHVDMVVIDGGTLEGILVADASTTPVVPRTNANLPVAVVGETIAALPLGET